MSPELAQLEMLAQVDDLVARLRRWAEEDSPWEPLRQCRALVQRVLSRVERLRIRLESPLVVAMFGGTGTGKSTLVNALVGRECTATGRSRPTTTRPVLVAHPHTPVEALGIPLEQVQVVRVEAPLLRDIVLVDCPDPDTTEAETAGSNLQRLHQLLPACDVLIYTSTQQKYRSARVRDELLQAAEGCRLVFVQTHADLDDDIRDDWRARLSETYEVPDMFLVDSPRALEEQTAGRKPTGDFGRLLDLLTTELSASQRVRIRRANLLDLIHGALEACRARLAEHQPLLEQLQAALDQQRSQLIGRMAERLQRELLQSRHLWEHRLLNAVTETWGFSPFSAMLRLYGGLGNLVASFGLFRARSSAQMALIGALQGARWLQARQEERRAEHRLERAAGIGLDLATLQEARLVMQGYVRTARLDAELLAAETPAHLQRRAADVEEEFLADARRRIDELITDLAARNSRLWTRAWYEVWFGAYLLFVLFRVGKNFFYDTFLREWLVGEAVPPAHLLSVDFYIAAGVFFVLWTGLLVMAFTRRLRRGLGRKIAELSRLLIESRLSQGLFPQLEDACRHLQLQTQRLDELLEATRSLRRQIATTAALGTRTAPVPPAVAAAR